MFSTVIHPCMMASELDSTTAPGAHTSGKRGHYQSMGKLCPLRCSCWGIVVVVIGMMLPLLGKGLPATL